MISIDLALRLKEAGVVWTPASGDRFVVLERDMDDLIFAISDMVVEVMDLPTGRILAFNGTTEWALDDIEEREVVWLPGEDQLRAMLGETFVALESVPGGFVVRVGRNGSEERHVDLDAESAYARAVLDRSGS